MRHYDEDNYDYLKKLSKKELIELVKIANEEKKHVISQQQYKINQLFKTIGKIKWQETLKPAEVDAQKEEDYHKLFNDVSSFQKDMYETLEEYKLLTKNLEKKVEERSRQIAKKEANLSSLIENTKDLICLVDRNYHVLIANTAFIDFIRISLNEEIRPGVNLSDILRKNNRSQYINYFERALSGEHYQFVFELIQSENQSFFEASFNPIYERSGIYGFSLFVREITDQKKSEENLKRNQQLLASINSNIKEGIYRSTEDKELIYVNPAFVEMFGYHSEEEIINTPFSELYVNPEDRIELLNLIKKENKITNQEVLLKRKDGSSFWGLMTSKRIVDNTGKEYYDGAIRNISRIKEAEEKLKQHNEELKKVNQELDRFVYSASHDLRAPLLSIEGLIGITKLEKDKGQVDYCLSLMEKSVKKLDSFIKDIISYSRNKRLILSKDKINFEQIITTIFEDLKYLKKSQYIKPVLKIEDIDNFYTDERRLKVILYNLVANAINYSNPLQSEPVISICVTLIEEKVQVQISDNGQGIPEQHLDRIFEMFYRASEQEAGSGLGLYIVKETLIKLRGNIKVESKVGEGTTFTIYIPSLPKNSN